ncbi:RES domain-containing protein [Sulfitobacter brevis]|uniref:RES domain-containing protein n=1 Tax=Sulfitobacter brevis TaxID=74348 RepID=A0A1I2HDS0_9RHOB|nr:RES family NAD+ phosphorylase [Sulfitobacter brevis]SFF26886.1 RES domain-containing protein [Sulfitobacter brevis]
MPLKEGHFIGQLYRALNPVYARTPLSGRGAELYGGRFNAKGTPALYLAVDPTGALREANQAGSLQPTVLVSYKANLRPVFNSSDTGELQLHGISERDLADASWRTKMLDGQTVPTQKFAAVLISNGFAGLLFQSYAKGASATDFNIVLWKWTGDSCDLEVVDDEGRLSRL